MQGVFLLTDVVGSTALWERFGSQMAAALAIHDAALHGAIKRRGGNVFKHTGDGCIAVFEDADTAAAAALEAANKLAEGPWPDTGPLVIRIAIHLGEATERDGDFFGTAINRTARINAVANPGQILISDEARRAMHTHEPLPLGTHQLRDLSDPIGLWQLDDGDHPPLRTLVASRHSLPRSLSEFIGRETEVDELRSLIRNHRLVTVTGVGGCGKTRLAIETAARTAEDFPHGVWFVDLGNEWEGDRVTSHIAAAMGVEGMDGLADMELLHQLLRGQQMLLVVDNCEHLIDDVADTLEEVLSVEGPSALTTSREPLGLDGERVYRIPNMGAASVELFVDRAKASGGQDLEPHLDQVARVCAALDEIPLAIELAASRLGALSLDAVERSLEERFTLLGGGRHSRRRRQRQQTLQAMMDWSYELLSPDEKLLLGELAVFAQSFSAVGVTAVSTLPPATSRETLLGLVDQSLVAPFDDDRYRLLETVRLYALDRLVAAGRLDTMRDRHLEWVIASCGVTIERHLERDCWVELDTRRIAEAANCVAAIEWAVEVHRTEDAWDVFTGALSVWASQPEFTAAAAAWSARIPPPTRADGHWQIGWEATRAIVAFAAGLSGEAYASMDAAAEHLVAAENADPYGDWDVWAFADGVRGLFRIAMGDTAGARADGDRLRARIDRGVGLPYEYIADSIEAMLVGRRDPTKAIPIAERAVENARFNGAFNRNAAEGYLAQILLHGGRPDEAAELAEQLLVSGVLGTPARLHLAAISMLANSRAERLDQVLDLADHDWGPLTDELRMLWQVVRARGLAEAALANGHASIAERLIIAVDATAAPGQRELLSLDGAPNTQEPRSLAEMTALADEAAIELRT